MVYPFVVSVREGLEAALIIGIMLAYLDKMRRRGAGYIWAGSVSALALSLAAGVGIYLTAGRLSGKALDIFEGAAMLLAVGVLTAMIFWMRSQAAGLKGNLQHQVEKALARDMGWSLALLAFTVVIREGIETVLFLVAGVFNAGQPLAYAAGGLLGLGLAALLGYSIYRGAGVLPLRSFFNVTSVLLVFLSAGMLMNALTEFHEVGLVPPLIGHVWDTYAILADSAGPGQFLSALFGYTAAPSLTQVLAYTLYLAGALGYYFWPQRARQAGRTAQT